MPKVGVAYVSIRARLDKLEKDLDTAKSTTLRRANETSKAVSNVFRGAVAYFGVREMVRFGESIFDAGRQVARLEKAFTEITGSAAASNKEFAYLRETADAMGQNFYDLADAYKSFMAASKGTALEGRETQKIFTAVTKAAASLGLTSENTRGALYAIQQMMSKGKVSAEELRQQLGERLPGAFNLMAEAVGVTAGELSEMLARGEVLAADALPKLARVLESRYTGAVDDATRASNKWNEAWMDLKANLASGEVMDDAVKAIQAFTNTINSKGFQEGLKVAIGLLADLASGFSNIVQSFAGWAAVKRGDLGFFEFATMNAQDLAKWLEENYSEAGKLQLRLNQLQLQMQKESSYLAYSPQGQAAKQARIDAIHEEMEALKAMAAMYGATDANSPKEPSIIKTPAPAGGDVTTTDKAKLKAIADYDRESLELFYNDDLAEQKDMLGQALTEIQADLDRWGGSLPTAADWELFYNDDLAEQKDMLGTALEEIMEDIEREEAAAKKLSDEMTAAFAGWANSFASDLNDMVWGAEKSFSEIAKSFGKMITQMLIQKALIEPFMTSLTSSFSGGSSFLSGLFSSGGGYVAGAYGMADGGIIREPIFGIGRSGQTYNFGEGGKPEFVIPADKMGGGGGTMTFNMAVTVQAIDSKSGMQFLKENAAGVADAMVDQLKHSPALSRFVRNG